MYNITGTQITSNDCNFHITTLKCAELRLIYTCASGSMESIKMANK